MANPDYDYIDTLIKSAKDLANTFQEDLARTISNAVKGAGSTGGSYTAGGQDSARRKYTYSAGSQQKNVTPEEKLRNSQSNSPYNNNVKRPYGSTSGRNNTSRAIYEKQQKPPLYKAGDSEKTGGMFKTIFGFSLAAVGALVLGGAGLRILGGDGIMETLGTLLRGGVLMGVGLPLGLNGTKTLSRLKRYAKYLKELGNKTVIQLKQLASSVGKSPEYVKKDLQDMSDRRYFTQGHFDAEGSQFMTSDETYQNYLYLAKEKQKAEEVNAQADQLLREAGLSSAGIELVKQGQEYLTKIQHMNAELPGAEITEKLQNLESIISRIIEEVKKQPGKATELRRMMNYYLPTVWNLLNTYKQIEEEPVKTGQMIATQVEIEKTLDMVGDAFENLLDRLFQDKSWDVSTDISVLNSMLEQDSLKDNELLSYMNKGEE